MICRFLSVCHSTWEDSRELRVRAVESGYLAPILMSWAGVFGQSLVCVVVRGMDPCGQEREEGVGRGRSGTDCRSSKASAHSMGGPGVCITHFSCPSESPIGQNFLPWQWSAIGFGLPWGGCALGEVLCTQLRRTLKELTAWGCRW